MGTTDPLSSAESIDMSSGPLTRTESSAVFAIVGRERNRIESRQHATTRSWLKNTPTILVISFMRRKNLRRFLCLTSSAKHITTRLLHNRGRLATVVINASLLSLTMGNGSVGLVLPTGSTDFPKGN